MAKDYTNLAESLTELVGGKDNIKKFTHCTTRLRFGVKDKGLVQVDAGLYFLPVFIGGFAARRFGGDMGLGMLMGAMLIALGFISGIEAGTAFSFLRLPIYSAFHFACGQTSDSPIIIPGKNKLSGFLVQNPVCMRNLLYSASEFIFC